ncbi:MAG: ISLre2 family transposase [Lachnospiraceae bacterium]|nr:ISLre2 family transposase [Lachnospiraceae bacterium]
MNNSIQQFASVGVKNISNVFSLYTEDMTKLAEMVYGVTNEVTKLGCNIIAEEWESYDELLRKRKDLRKGWQIVRRDETSLLTSLGEVIYHKTLFKNTETMEYCYLLDQLMGIEHHARITEDAEARILQEASESSYRKGGASASIKGDSISKEAVMNKLHRLKFPAINTDEKKDVKVIYIDADEDHVSLQYLEHKGDIRKPRINTVMPRIIYVYEGVDTDEEGRPKLINTKYFGGVYDGQNAINELWKEVLDYLDKAYDMEKIERVYINGDGATWIRSGEKLIPKAKFSLDKYHMHKYIIAATSHLEDSADDARSEIYRAIHKKKKWMAERTFDKIISITDKDTKRKAVEQAKAYILGNWSGIMTSMKSNDVNVRCSAEGHVSHVYADRMSSRPLGWCKVGADKMSRLRIYRQNQGNMLELVRYQTKELKQAAGAEEVIYSAQEMIRMENANKRRLGAMADVPVYSIPYTQIKKIAALKNHIWGL